MMNKNLVDSMENTESNYKDKVRFQPFLMSKFVKDLGGNEDNRDEITSNSQFLYYINNRTINFCMPMGNFENPDFVSIAAADIINITDALSVFPDYVFDCLEDEKVKLYLIDYAPLISSDDFALIENEKDEKIKVSPLTAGINTYLMEAIADSIDDKFGVFTETDEFNKLYEDNKIKIRDLNDDLYYELDTPIKFLTSCLYSYYTYDEYFHCGCQEVCDYIENIDNKLKEMYDKKNNKVFTKNKR